MLNEQIDQPTGASPRYVPALLIVFTLIAMSPLLLADFTNWDDQKTIVGNAWLNPPEPAHFVEFWNPKPPVFMDIYIPVTYTVWSAVAWISYVPTADPETHTHLNSWMFHGANLLVHACSVLLVYLILKRLVRRSWAAAAGAALFAIHPVQVEPVGWLSGMKDVLSGCLGLLAIWQYLLFASAAKSVADDGGIAATSAEPLPLRYVLATFAFVLAMLAKPSGVVVPLVAAAIDLFALRRPPKRVIAALFPWLLLAIPIVIEGRIAQPATHLAQVTPIALRPLIAADALGYYLYKLFFPLRLGIIYDRTPAAVLHHHWHYFTWLLPLAVVAALWIWRRRFPWLIAAVGVYWLAVLPVLGLVPFDFQDFSTVADHYLYLAMLGPAIAVAFALRNARRQAIAPCAILLFVLGARTWLQARTWDNSITLYQNSIRLNPEPCGPYVNLAYAYEDQHRFPEAIATLEEGLGHAPHCAPLEIKLGRLLGNEGKLDEADALFHDAARNARGMPDLMKLVTDGLAQIRQARRAAATRPAAQKGPTVASPHLTPASQPIK